MLAGKGGNSSNYNIISLCDLGGEGNGYDSAATSCSCKLCA